MKKIKVLNLYACVGGNRSGWNDNDVEVVAIEIDPKIAAIYKERFPNDEVLVCDAHEYLLDHYNEFDFIWSSPPCPTHSKVRFANTNQNKPIYPDMKLYQEILFLKHYFKGVWVVENVISFYNPLIKPQIFANHFWWSNVNLGNYKGNGRGMGKSENINDLYKLKEFDLSKYKDIDKKKTIRNMVEPKVSRHIFNMLFKEKQKSINNFGDVSE